MRRMGITIWLAAAVAALAWATTAPAAKHRRAHHAAGSVQSVSNPPSAVPSRLKLTVRAVGVTSVSVYASPIRGLTAGDVALARNAKVRHRHLSVDVPRKLGPGAWFVVVCPAKSHKGCASSRAPMARLAASVPAPVEGHPSLQAANAASTTIGAAGGALDATAADGTRFHLVIAAGSVPDGTQITLTPASSLGAGPAASFVAGVQLAPEGLILLHGGTLTITPTRSVPIARQVAYGYDGSGDDVHEVPLAPTHEIEIPLAHFSGVGLLDSAENALAASGSGVLDKYSALIANEMWLARMGYISESTAFDDSLRLIPKMLSDVMAAEVPPGLGDDDAAVKAIKDLITVARVSELLGGAPDGVFDEVKPTVYKLLEGIYKRAQQKCANHDLSQVKRIIDADRSEQLLGFTGHELSEDTQCLKFRIDFDSAIDVIAGSGGSGSWHLEYVSHPTVTYDLTQAALTGSDFGTYAAASGTMTGDDGTTVQVTSGRGDSFEVVKLSLSADPTDTSPTQLILNLHSPSEQYHAHDPSGPYDSDYTDHNWLNTFNQFHNPQNGWNVLQLERVTGDGELVARGTWTSSSPDGSATEATTVDVFHTPPPPPA